MSRWLTLPLADTFTHANSVEWAEQQQQWKVSARGRDALRQAPYSHWNHRQLDTLQCQYGEGHSFALSMSQNAGCHSCWGRNPQTVGWPDETAGSQYLAGLYRLCGMGKQLIPPALLI
jgi:hypothetical protein